VPKLKPLATSIRLNTLFNFFVLDFLYDDIELDTFHHHHDYTFNYSHDRTHNRSHYLSHHPSNDRSNNHLISRPLHNNNRANVRVQLRQLVL
jgi:hypothetical protein